MTKKKVQKRERYSEKFKVNVLRTYLGSPRSLNSVAEQFDLYPQQILRWKDMLEFHAALKGLKKPEKVVKGKSAGKKAVKRAVKKA